MVDDNDIAFKEKPKCGHCIISPTMYIVECPFIYGFVVLPQLQDHHIDVIYILQYVNVLFQSLSCLVLQPPSISPIYPKILALDQDE